MRKIIETERVDLFDVSMMITMCVRINRSPSYDELNKAFKKACNVHEILNSKVIIENSGDAYYIENDRSVNSFEETQLTLTGLIDLNEKRRFRIEDGEFLRGFNSPDGIVFMMHHLGGDGKSLLYFIETFMRCLDGEEPEKLPLRNLTLKDLPKESSLPFFYEWLIYYWNKKWSKEKKNFVFDDLEKSHNSFWDKHHSELGIVKYEKDELDNLLKNAKESGVSLTSYLITDMIKDCGKKMDIGLAVDGRQDKNRNMGNQATGISVQYRYDMKKSVGENARAVHALMQKKLTKDKYRYFVLQFMGKLDPSLKDALNLEHSGYFHSKASSKVAEILGYGDKVRDLSITNLTKADIPLSYGNTGIEEIIFIPPVVSYAVNVIGIVTT
ncbi:MAG: hypothetical protein K6G75_09025, partial [Lachnospiraceae bacterium]|nr:hypothetical protein [Lachnospiraceae bacterium]